MNLLTPWFQTSGFQSCEYISVALSHSFGGHLLQQPQKLIQPLQGSGLLATESLDHDS